METCFSYYKFTILEFLSHYHALSNRPLWRGWTPFCEGIHLIRAVVLILFQAKKAFSLKLTPIGSSRLRLYSMNFQSPSVFISGKFPDYFQFFTFLYTAAADELEWTPLDAGIHLLFTTNCILGCRFRCQARMSWRARLEVNPIGRGNSNPAFHENEPHWRREFISAPKKNLHWRFHVVHGWTFAGEPHRTGVFISIFGIHWSRWIPLGAGIHLDQIASRFWSCFRILLKMLTGVERNEPISSTLHENEPFGLRDGIHLSSWLEYHTLDVWSMGKP